MDIKLFCCSCNNSHSFVFFMFRLKIVYNQPFIIKLKKYMYFVQYTYSLNMCFTVRFSYMNRMCHTQDYAFIVIESSHLYVIQYSDNV